MADATPGSVPSSNRNVMIVLSYLWLLALVPLLTEKDDKEVQWHAKNGLVLLGAEIIFIVLFVILGFLDITFCGTTIIQCVVWIGFLVIRIMAIMKAVNGQRMRIPVVSDMADKM